MSPLDTTQRALALVQTLSGDAQTHVRNPRSTVAPPRHDRQQGARILALLRTLSRPPPALEDEGTLGRGGMGVVQLATQVTLGRKVAVKRLVAGNAASEDIEALLSEAWLAGSLEHPNIVPVHDLGLDAAGLPVLVMKRIEGLSWASLLRDPEALAAHAPGRAPLEAHLRILLQVCNALHYAHARGVVHRDVKPDNVMVGAFGEVYLVDWGIASAPGLSPQLAGTPVYMAPEMLGGQHAVISPQTDVYLLGAVLCELLTGKAPHDASTPERLAQSVLASAPVLPDSAPLELAALARLCMSADPAQRPESALAVRVALEDFLAHLGSLELTTQAERRLAELTALLSGPAPEARRVFDLFSECRFGFQQALRGWPHNVRARFGLDTAVRAMVRFELSAGSARSAQSLLGELVTPDPELAAQVEVALAAEAHQKQDLARLAALEKSLDPDTGGSVRTWIALGGAVMWVIAPLVGRPMIARWPHYEMPFSSIVSGLSTVALLFVQWRTKGVRTPLNEQLLRVMLFSMGAQTAALLGLYFALGDAGAMVAPVLAFFWFVLAGIIAAAFLTQLWWTAAGYLLVSVFSAAFPPWRYEIIALGNVVLAVNVSFLLKRLLAPAPR